MAVDERSQVSFSITQGTLPWQPVFVGFYRNAQAYYSSAYRSSPGGSTGGQSLRSMSALFLLIRYDASTKACLVNPADRQANRQTLGCENDHPLKSY